MSNAPALDSARTGTPDGTNGIKIPTVLCQEDATLEAPGGVALSCAIPQGLVAHRAGVTSDSGVTDMTVATFGASGLETINNRGALAVFCIFNTLSASAVISPIWYGESTAATATPLAAGDSISFVGSSKMCAASGNRYLSKPQIVETFGFRKYKFFLESLTAGSIVDIYAIPV